MKFDILIQFIVPLTFLAIWALTSILNRDAQPLPPRLGGRPPGPGGPQPVNRLPAPLVTRQIAPGRPPAQPAQATPSPPPAGTATATERAAGWSGPAPAPLSRDRTGPTPVSGKLDDAIVYLEGEPPARGISRPSSLPSSNAGGPGSPQASLRSTRSSPPRRSARGRIAPARNSPAAKPEPETRRVLTDQVGQSMAMERSKPLEIVPLSASMAPLSRPLSQTSPVPGSLAQTSASWPAVSSTDVRRMLATPGKLRELVLLSEILQPPLALRRRHRRI